MPTTDVRAFRLSIQQERIWSFQHENPAYRSQCAALLKGGLDLALFMRALQALIDRHDILRTAFSRVPGMDMPLQMVSSKVKSTCPLIDLEDLPALEQDIQSDTCFSALRSVKLDLECSSSLYTALVRLSPDTHILFIWLPALCADSATMCQLVAELGRIYAALYAGQALTNEVLQYADVSAWQNKLIASEDAAFQRQYWQNIDKGQLAATPLPFVKEEAAKGRVTLPRQGACFAPGMLKISLEETVSTRLKALALQHHVSLVAWLLASWQVAIWRLSQGSSSLIGVACDGRIYEELANLPGLYTRIVPISTPLTDDFPFEQAVHLLQTSLQDAIKWQTSFVWEEESNDETNHFFPVSFEHNDWPAAFEAGPLTLSLHRCFSCTEPFTFKLSVLQRGEDVQLELHYDAGHVAPQAANHLASLLHTLLLHTAEQSQRSISTLRIVPASEQDTLLRTFRAPIRPLPFRGFHQLFEAQVERTPEHLAVLSAQEQFTYRELNSRANQLAQILIRYGVGPNIPVALSVPRSASMLIGLLAILKAGGAYVPLDPDMPHARLVYQLNNVQAPFLITLRTLQTRWSDWQGTLLCLEDLADEMSHESVLNPNVRSEPGDLAYVIYTSGSTGVPKGVMIQQQSVVNYTLALTALLHAESGWQYATVSTLAADLGNTVIFCALASGGCLHVLDYATIISGETFARWTAQHPIDVLKIVPSHLSALLISEHAQKMLPRRALVLGGETLPPDLLETLRELADDCTIYNHYGPTEATIGTLVYASGPAEHAAEEGQRDTRAPVPLGRPITNNEVYVLDRNMQLVPTGITGELYIGGIGLAAGYVHLPEQTAQRFVPHPFSQQAGARLYRTGDLARYTDQGLIEFAGRSDRQVKLRGYRIELGEIEATLRKHPDIWDVAVTLPEHAAEDSPHAGIRGYVVTRHRSRLTSAALSSFTSEFLPEYMIPSTFIFLDNLPLTANGKVDYRQLPEPDAAQNEELSPLSAPRSPIEEMLAEIWRELLKVPSIGIHDNFFQLGGHSLLATQVISRIQMMLHVELSVLSIFEAPTLAEMARRIERELHGEQARLPLVRVPRTQDLPLSFAQQRLWFFSQLEPGNPSYNKSIALWLKGALDSRALEYSFGEVTRRHEVLRTTFRVQADLPRQVIQPMRPFVLPIVDLLGLEQGERVKEARQLAAQEAQRFFHLEKGPLFYASLVKVDVQEYVLLLTMHHIISDGWSNAIFMRELKAFYRASTTGQAASLSPLPIQYADFAVWQRNWLQGEALAAQIAYWRQQLAGAAPLELSTDHPRPPIQTYRGAVQFAQLPAELVDGLTALCQQQGVTLFMMLLAAFQTLLMRYTGQYDICVGSPIANRTHADVEKLIGFFVNTLVLRTDLSGNPSFSELIARVRETTLGAYAHQDMPFELLVEELQPERSLSRSPLFQVMFSVQQFSLEEEVQWEEYQQGPLLDGKLETERITTKFDFTLLCTPDASGLHCCVEYSTDLFETATMQRLLIHWQTILEGVVANPTCPLADLPLLTTAERVQLLASWNASTIAFPPLSSLSRLLEAQVDRLPDAVALTFEETHLTYEALDLRANQLGHSLQEQGVQQEEPVGICMPRSLELVVGVLGILKAGGAYVPLDSTLPTERFCFLLEHVGVRLVIGQQELREAMSEAFEGRALVCLDQVWSRLACQRRTRPDGAVSLEQMAYVIYTSGSTGRPKGVMVTHRNALQSTLARHHRYPHPVHSYLFLSPLSFDSSVAGLFWTLSQGGRLVVPGDHFQQDLEALACLMARQAISHLLCVPSLYAALLDIAPQCTWHALRWAIVAGESCPPALLQRHRALLPQTTFANEYGPTEATVWSSVYLDDGREHARAVPIGHPIANAQLYLLDAAGHPVPIGVTGELFIGGSGIARGYVKRADLTAERFLPHPFCQEPGARLYRSGDLARYQEDGSLQYVGRTDQQVKVRGYRIEPGEIETALREHQGVREAVVMAREDRTGEKRLVAYVVPDRCQGEGTAALPSLLRHVLKERLPAYMVPSSYLILDHLPLTANEKLDRQALPLPDDRVDEGSEREPSPAAPNPIAEMIATIWSDLLNLKGVRSHDNFFDLGGHSLLATRLIARVQAVTGVKVSLRRFFEIPTLEELAQEVEQGLRRGQGGEVELLQAGKRPAAIPLSFAQQRLWFLDRLNPGDTAYIIPNFRRFHGTLEIPILLLSLNGLVFRHESLRTTFQIQGDQPVQIIHRTGWIDIPLIDLRELAEVKREKEARRLIGQEAQVSFNLVQGPLLRSSLLRLGAQEHILLLTMHHIISDGWSMNIFYDELTALYQALATGKPFSLPPLPIQYADFALWQRQWLQGEVLETQLAYWRQQLREPLPVVQLPAARPRPLAPTSDGGVYRFNVPEELLDRSKKLGQQAGTTLFMTLMSAFQCLLHYYTGLDDIVVGTDVANRNRTEVEGLIGFFVNQLVFRMNLSGDPRIREILQQAREVALGAYVHQDLPFDRLVEVLKPERVPGSTPLFQVKFVLQNLPTRVQAFSNRDAESPEVVQRIAKFDLLLNMVERERQLTGWLIYNAAMFDRATIRKFAEHLVFVLQRMTDAPDSHLEALMAEIDLLEREKQYAVEAELQQAGLHRLKQVKRKLSRK